MSIQVSGFKEALPPSRSIARFFTPAQGSEQPMTSHLCQRQAASAQGSDHQLLEEHQQPMTSHPCQRQDQAALNSPLHQSTLNPIFLLPPPPVQQPTALQTAQVHQDRSCTTHHTQNLQQQEQEQKHLEAALQGQQQQEHPQQELNKSVPGHGWKRIR